MLQGSTSGSDPPPPSTETRHRHTLRKQLAPWEVRHAAQTGRQVLRHKDPLDAIHIRKGATSSEDHGHQVEDSL